MPIYRIWLNTKAIPKMKLNNLPNVTLEQGTSDAAELFADTFAIAVMCGSDLCSFSPFPFSDALNEAFEKFYTKLFNKYCGKV